jgi:hypothetical protein
VGNHEKSEHLLDLCIYALAKTVNAQYVTQKELVQKKGEKRKHEFKKKIRK